MTKLSAHFDDSEFKCKCCGEFKINGKLIDLLEKLRARFGRPITITSGYRCKFHNTLVGGVDNSQHCLGTAADIKIDGIDPIDVAFAARDVGFTGIGVYDSWTHVDVRDGKLAYWDKRSSK